jgi:UDP-GlcNAc:undecaprenyl-phosphate/decaprenyl-phosphate GlcNAc-1-phosphate transferase
MDWFLGHIKHIFFEQESSQPLAFLIAFIITYTITPLIKERAEMLDNNNREEEGRASNHKSLPRLGGIAILISIILTIVFYLAVFGTYTPHGIEHLDLEAIAVGTLIIFFIGLLDDLKPLDPFFKLVSQVIAATLVWVMGIRIEFIANPIHYIDHARAAAFDLSDPLSLLVTVFFIVAITNAINFIDGIDGLAVGVCLIASITSWAINLSPLLNQPAGAILAATMAGACFAFLRYNFNPARIFLGDNGSYLLGFGLACISCIGLTKQVTVVVLSPIFLLIFLVPLADAAFAVLRRASKKQSIMKPDLEHIHHQLLNKGFSEKQINYVIYTITFLGGLLGTSFLGIDIALEYLIICATLLLAWMFFSLVLNAKRQRNNNEPK